MTKPNFKHCVWYSTGTAGTGTVTLGSVLPSFFPMESGDNGKFFYYVITDISNQREIGQGIYTHSGTTFSRTLIQSTTGSLLNLSGQAKIAIGDISVIAAQLLSQYNPDTDRLDLTIATATQIFTTDLFAARVRISDTYLPTGYLPNLGDIMRVTNDDIPFPDTDWVDGSIIDTYNPGTGTSTVTNLVADSITADVADIDNATIGGVDYPTSPPATGQVLTAASSSAGAWTTPFVPVCGRMTNSASQGSLGSTAVKLEFPTTVFAVNVTADTTNDRFTATIAGIYQVTATALSSYPGRVELAIHKNGTRESLQHENNTTLDSCSVMLLLELDVGNYVEIFYSDVSSGNSQSTTVNFDRQPQFMISRVG